MAKGWKMTGFKEMDQVLRNLPQTVARGVLVRTGVDAMKPMEEAMARNAPFDPADRDNDGKHLNETMRTQALTAKRSRKFGGLSRRSGVTVVTGPAPTGKRARANAGWQEKGTVKMPGTGYATRAFDAEAENVLRRIGPALWEQITKGMRRFAKRVARGR